jgi:hypothetical protein
LAVLESALFRLDRRIRDRDLGRHRPNRRLGADHTHSVVFARAASRGGLAPIASVEYLEAELVFARNDGLGRTIAQLELTNRPAGCIDLPKNYRRLVYGASRRSTRRRVAASPDLNSRRRGIEVRFEHRLVSITIDPLSLGAFAPLSRFASTNYPVQSRYLAVVS